MEIIGNYMRGDSYDKSIHYKITSQIVSQTVYRIISLASCMQGNFFLNIFYINYSLYITRVLI